MKLLLLALAASSSSTSAAAKCDCLVGDNVVHGMDICAGMDTKHSAAASAEACCQFCSDAATVADAKTVSTSCS